MKKIFLFLLIFLGLSNSVYAENSNISNSPLNITIVPFEIDGASVSDDINKIITNNLNRSGRFKASISEALTDSQIDFNFWKQLKRDAIVFGKIEQISSNVYNVYVYVYDVISEKSLYQKKIRVHNSGFRRIAHFLSDKIHEIFIGTSGGFDTRLAYVSVIKSNKDESTYKLEISDSDGFNHQTVVRSSKPILSVPLVKSVIRSAELIFELVTSALLTKISAPLPPVSVSLILDPVPPYIVLAEPFSISRAQRKHMILAPKVLHYCYSIKE